jgi:AraC family transcriptional regulator, positive regulator of tynA and feaB
MKLAVYDLVGALFGVSDRRPVSGHAEKLFARIRQLITDHFSDPDFGPLQGRGRSVSLITLPSEALHRARLDL